MTARKKQSLPRVITLRITGECNMRCPFCFGPNHELEAAPLSRITEVARRLQAYGVEAVTVTGGEPLLVSGLPILLKKLKEIGFQVYLSTNGLLLQQLLNEIAPYIDWIGLPIDADCSRIHQRMRGGHETHFEMILKLIGLVRKEYPGLIIKVGTVISSINKDNIIGIPEILNSATLPDIWKTFPIIYSGYAKDNRSILELTDQEYETIAVEAVRVAKTVGLPTEVFEVGFRKGNYLLFEPTGEALAVTGHDEISIGNSFDDLDNVVRNWQSFVNPSEVRKANLKAINMWKSVIFERKK